MKYLNILLPIYTLAARAQADDIKDCKDLSVDGGNLKAQCKDGKARFQCSVLDLDECYEYTHGEIKPKRSGRFKKSGCGDCDLHGTDLTCDCDIVDMKVKREKPLKTTSKPKPKKKITASINPVIENDDGFLKCFGNKARRCDQAGATRSIIRDSVGSGVWAAVLGALLGWVAIL